MQNAATGNDDAPAGILGANEANLPSPPSKTTKSVGDDASVLVVACRQCRLRKVRCDSGRPMCKNCARRSDPCEYDIAPKRRGPDKQPGTRQRLCKKRPEDVTPPPKRTAKPRPIEGPGLLEQYELQGPQRTSRIFSDSIIYKRARGVNRIPLPKSPIGVLQESVPQPANNDDLDLDATLRAVGFESLERLLRITNDEVQATAETYADGTNAHYRHWTSNPTSFHQDYISSIYPSASDNVSELVTETYIPRGPSSSFHKKTWWDSLLSLYSEDPTQSALKVFQDLNFLLNNTAYWLSFISFPRFMENLYNPNARIFVQPSLVLSALALSTMMKSSEVGLGGEGRKFALWLRDAAQSSLDASIGASWIEPSLAQAAFFLALFEATPHPTHSGPRISSSISLLDSLIQALSLTTIDAHEPTVTTFMAQEIPRVASPSARSNFPQPNSGISQSEYLKDNGIGWSKCTCAKVAAAGLDAPSSNWEHVRHGLGQLFNKSNHTTPPSDRFPLLLGGKSRLMTDWPELTDTAEIQKEESRRLCWSSMMLVTALREYTPIQFERSVWDLHVTKHENFALFFPGEKVCKTNPKGSIWALHSRAAILWNSCQKLRSRPDWEYRRIELAGKAWVEADAIEQAMEGHACPEGHGVPYAGREYLLQLKLLISNQFMSSAPIPHTLGHQKNSAKEWLTHRAGICRHVRKMAYFLTLFGATIATVALAKRPMSIWWAMYQLRAGVLLWKSDPTLTVALEQSVDFLAIIDFISVMWPSDAQRRSYDQIRSELLRCCGSAGICVPAAIPIPGLPVNLHATMTPSLSIARKPSPSDILMEPLD